MHNNSYNCIINLRIISKMEQPTTLINKPFKTFYDNLPASYRNGFVTLVMQACDISLATFYYWLDHPTAIKKPAQEKIAQIAGKSVEEIFTNSTNA